MPQPPTSMTDVLRHLPVPLFTSSDVTKFVANANVFLFRAGRKGYVQKITNRIYWNVLFYPQAPAVEQVACFARQPSYISGEWALNHHGVLLQSPTVCTAVSLHGAVGRRNRISFAGCIIEYSRIKAELYLPDEIYSHDGFLLATPEKALLDTIYLRRRLPFADELEIDVLNQKKLAALAARYPAVVGRRLKTVKGMDL